MMELTKDNVVITSDGDIFIPVIGFRDIKSRLPQGKELKQQIVDDYERARTYDEIAKIIPEMYKDWKSILPQIKQNQKLQKLIEKEIESGQDGRIQSSLLFLQNILKDSKK